MLLSSNQYQRQKSTFIEKVRTSKKYFSRKVQMLKDANIEKGLTSKVERRKNN
jgi:hypothetical protein